MSEESRDVPLSNERRLAAIVFTDVVGYSARMQRDETGTLALVRIDFNRMRALCAQHGGEVLKSTGDGLLLCFASVVQAVACTLQIQREFTARPSDALQHRMGIHLGDVFREGGDVVGDGVNIAARLEAKARPGTICVSQSVYDAVKGKLPMQVESLGPQQFKNITESIAVHLVAPSSATASEAGTKAGWTGWLAGVAFVVAAVLALIFWPKSVPSTASKSVAVLPFVNMGADKADEYLGDGMTEELLNALAKVKSLRVPGRSSCFAFKGRNEEGIFHKVGEQLQVSTVLEGSIRKAGDKLRITAQLINVADGYHLWSETYDREMTDILAIQTDVAQRVVQALQVQLGVEETRALARRPTDNAEAHRLYLLGRYYYHSATETGWNNAMRYFKQALQLDPGYARAYCGLADTYGWMGGQVMPGKEAWAREKEMAQKALALDPQLVEARLSLGVAMINGFEWREGGSMIKRAIESDPNLAMAHDQYCWFLACYLGQVEEAVAEGKKAVQLDPLSVAHNLNLGWYLHWARRYDEAIAQARKTLELDPHNAYAQGLIGMVLIWKGDIAAAITELQKAKALEGLPWVDGYLGYAFAISGDRTKAERILLDLDDTAKRRYVSPSASMTIYLGLGETDRALDRLEQCCDEQDAICWELKISPLFDRVRNEPRFQAVAKKAGLGP